MPILIEETEVNLDRADLLNRQPITRPSHPPARSPGVHLSGVLRYIAQTSGIKEYQSDVELESLPLNWALGIAWEEFAVSLYPDTVWQPGEADYPCLMTCDGQYFEFDLLTDVSMVIEEFKWTSKKRKSGLDFLAKEWLWLCQGKGYCVGYGAEYVRWHVCWCNQPWSPVYVRYLIQFDEKELQQMERLIKANVGRAAAAGFAE